jgi:hypothetical protein
MRHVEWQEIRSGELFFVEADQTIAGWTFSDRSTYEVRWFLVSPKAGWIEKAERLAKSPARDTHSSDHRDGELPAAMAAPDAEVGNFYDNASVLAVANWKINTGAVREGLTMLNVLRAHLVGIADPKSRKTLLSAVEDAIDLAYRKQGERWHAAEEVQVPQPQVHGIASPASASDARKLNHSSSDNVSQFKLQLVDVVGIVTALSWTHGILVHEIMTLPGLATSPTWANVLAGSALAVALRFVLRGRWV